jgi:hypothetical protein
LAPAPRPVLPQTLDELAHPDAFQVFQPAGPAPDVHDEPLQWDKLIFRPSFFYQFLYANGLQSVPGASRNTIIQNVSPGLLVNLGPEWVFDYTPTLRYYSNPHFQDGFDQSVVLRGGMSSPAWRLGLSQGYTATTDPTVETGTQVSQETYATVLTATRELTEALSLALQANQDFSFAGNPANAAQPNNASQNNDFQNSRSWSTLDFLEVKTTAHFNWGVGGGGGFVSEETGSDQTYEQVDGRCDWRLTDRISLHASAGLEDYQFLGGSQGDMISPIYNGSLQYQPFVNTRLSLDGSESLSPSMFQGEVADTTAYGVSLNQRLLGRLHLDLAGSHATVDYTGAGSAAPSPVWPVRGEAPPPPPPAAYRPGPDDYYSVTARLSCPLLHRGSVGISYQYSHNQSSTSGNYDTTQIGIDIGYCY